jgi:ABC-type uncharacterized transport system substrate-binding protein
LLRSLALTRSGRQQDNGHAADLLVQCPTEHSPITNLKPAKALGLSIPERVLEIADEVIE